MGCDASWVMVMVTSFQVAGDCGHTVFVPFLAFLSCFLLLSVANQSLNQFRLFVHQDAWYSSLSDKFKNERRHMNTNEVLRRKKSLFRGINEETTPHE